MTLPRKIGDYEVLGRIVHGQPVELFRARKGDGPVVCIKRLPPNLCDDEDLVLRFDTEMKIAVQLRHPNVVAVYDRGEDYGHYFVMEHVDGMDLGTLLRKRGPLDPEVVVHIAISVCKAFVYLHHSDAQPRDFSKWNAENASAPSSTAPLSAPASAPKYAPRVPISAHGAPATAGRAQYPVAVVGS